MGKSVSAARRPWLAETPPPMMTDRAPICRAARFSFFTITSTHAAWKLAAMSARAWPCGGGTVAARDAAHVVEDGGLQAAEGKIERFPAERRAGEVDRLRVPRRGEAVEDRP